MLLQVFTITHKCACPGECGNNSAITSTSTNEDLAPGSIAAINIGVLLLLM